MDAMTGSFQPNSINPMKLLLQIVSLFNDLNNMILFTELNEAYLKRRKKKLVFHEVIFNFLKNHFEKVKANLHMCSWQNLTIFILPKKLF